DGRTFDFHATRHSYITLLARSGVHPKMAQTLARRSSIDLTMNHYTHVSLWDQAAAVEARPSLLLAGPAGESQTLRATGTDGPSTTPLVDRKDSAPRPCRDQNAEAGCDPVRTAASGQAPGGGTGGCHNPLPMREIESDCVRLRGDEGRVGEGTRTLDIQIHSLTL